MSKVFPKEVFVTFDDSMEDGNETVLLASDDLRHLASTDDARPAARYVLVSEGNVVNHTTFEESTDVEESEEIG